MIRNFLVLLISPKVGWQYIDDKCHSAQRVLGTFFYPLLAILAISSFVPMIYDSASHTISSSLMEAIVAFSKYMLSYYLCVYLLSGFYPQFTRSSLAMSKLSNYVIYNLAFLIVLSILINVINGEFSPLYFLELYMPYIAYRGVDFLCVDSNKSAKFVVISSIMMIGFPIIIGLILNSLINH